MSCADPPLERQQKMIEMLQRALCQADRSLHEMAQLASETADTDYLEDMFRRRLFHGKTAPVLACSPPASSGMPESVFGFVKRSLHQFCIEAPMQKKEKSRLGFEPQMIRLLGRSTFRLSYWALLRVRLKRFLYTCILKF